MKRDTAQEISELQKALELNKEGLHDQERKARELLVKLDSMQGVEDVCCLRSTYLVLIHAAQEHCFAQYIGLVEPLNGLVFFFVDFMACKGCACSLCLALR
jgi:hypothetical protein